MHHRWPVSPRGIVLISAVLLLVFVLACGASATATPQPTNTPRAAATAAPAATIVPAGIAAPVATTAPASSGGAAPAATAVPTSAPAPTAAASQAKPKGTLNMGVPETGVFEAHPVLTSSPRISWTNVAVGEGVFTIRPDLSAAPFLAESWSVSEDFLTWTFNMRKGVQFHKGYGEMTAEDLVYSQQQFGEGAKHARAAFMKKFWGHEDGSVEYPNPHTVKVNTGEPWVDGRVFEWMANQGGASSWVVSKKQSDEVGADAASKNIAATGPWEIMDERAGEFWRMEAVEDHWRQTPYFHELTFWTVPEESSRVAGFQTGNLDTFQMEFDSIPVIEKVPGAKLMSVNNAGQAGLNIYGQTYSDWPEEGEKAPSYDPGLAWVSGNADVTSEEWQNAVKVKKAMAIAIDREAIVDTILRGFGKPLVLRDWAGHEGRMPERWKHDFDPGRARELLAEAGYPDGFSITLTPAIRSAPGEVEACQAVAQMWRDVGIDVKEQKLPYSTLRPSFISRTQKGATCHSVAIRLVVSVGAGNYANTSTFSYGTHHPDLDVLVKTAALEMDPAKRMLREVEIYDFMYDNVMAFGLYSFDAVWPVGPKIQEWEPDGYDDLRKVTGFQFIKPRE